MNTTNKMFSLIFITRKVKLGIESEGCSNMKLLFQDEYLGNPTKLHRAASNSLLGA